MNTPSIPLKRLSLGILSTDMAFVPSDILDFNGNALTSANFYTVGYGTFRNAAGTKVEFFTFDPATIASASVTILARGLNNKGGTTTGADTQYDWSANETIIVLGSNPPALFTQFLDLHTNQTIDNGVIKIFTTPPQTTSDPVAGNDVVRLSYVQALVLGTLTTIDLIVPGTAGATIANGNLIYFNIATSRWELCDADTASTVNNVLLGIAQGSGTSGNPITNGILLQGVDDAQSGLTSGSVYYASNTAGGISITAGTTEVTVGIAKSTTELYFCPRFNQQFTEDQQDALAGTSGTPSASNKFVTNDDTAIVATASKVVRTKSNGTIDPTFISGGNTLTVTYGETITAGQALYLKASDGKAYKARSLTVGSEEYLNYLGIALEAGSANDSKTVQIGGVLATGLVDFGSATTAVASTVDVNQTANGGTPAAIHSTSTPGQKFITGNNVYNIEKITVKAIGNSGSPTGNVTLTLYDNSGNSLGTVTQAWTASATNTFTFSSPITVSPNTQYEFRLTNSSGGGGANSYNIDTTNSNQPNGYPTTSGSITISYASLTFSTYYTSQLNWSVGDVVWLSDTAGSLLVNPTGTVKVPIGIILSQTTMKVEKSNGTTYIGSFSGTFAANSAHLSRYIATPKNATRFVTEIGTNPGSGTADSQFKGLTFDRNMTSLHSNDANGNGSVDNSASITSNVITVNVTNAANQVGTVYFYR